MLNVELEIIDGSAWSSPSEDNSGNWMECAADFAQLREGRISGTLLTSIICTKVHADLQQLHEDALYVRRI